MKGILKAVGVGIGYGIGMAGWVGVFAAGSLYGKYQACKLAKTDPEKLQDIADHHRQVDESGDNIMRDLGVL